MAPIARPIQRLGYVILLAATCGPSAGVARAAPPAGDEAGVVFVVDGIGGVDRLGAAARHALPKAGVPHEVRDFVWTHGWGKLFRDLQDFRYLLAKADELAEAVKNYQLARPGKPVYLVGRSGGAALVLAAAERLPPGTLERVILLSAAVAPTYDLRPALRATRREIVSFHSAHDRVILGWGTEKFGAADRYYGPSAGLKGFKAPADLTPEDRRLYGRLVQISWHPAMILEGHLGAHMGTAMPAFVAKEVAPWLKPDGRVARRR